MQAPKMNQLVIELPDLEVSKIAVDPTGQFVALAGSTTLTVLPLHEEVQRPDELAQRCITTRFSCQQSLAGLAWHPTDPSSVVVARNNRCELLAWDAVTNCLKSSRQLSGYVRSITSLDWNPLSPALIATSSADQCRSICLWDLREDGRRPSCIVESLAYPTRIKWNRADERTFASVQQTKIQLWDLRSSCSEKLVLFSESKVSDIDWNPSITHELASVNNGNKLNVWDTRLDEASPSHHEGYFGEGVPTKVVYSPTGEKLLTVTKQNTKLYSSMARYITVWRSNDIQMVDKTFWGLDADCVSVMDTVCSTNLTPVDVSWKVCKNSVNHKDLASANIELVTWCENSTLRFYPVRPHRSLSLRSQAAGSLDSTALDNTERQRNISGQRSSLQLNRPCIHFLKDRWSHPSAFDVRANDANDSGASTVSTDTSRFDAAQRMLAQELSLLSHREGQYKLEEYDLVNRTAKVILNYCRRKHHHHYAVCIGSNQRKRQPSSDTGDLDGLFLPASDMGRSTLVYSYRTNIQRDSPGSCDKDGRFVFSSNRDEIDNGTSTLMTRSISVVQSNKDNSELVIPVSGTVSLDLQFPLTYPNQGSPPVFTLVSCCPVLPVYLAQRLLDILNGTAASDLMQTSLGCVELCARKAVVFLQTAPALARSNNSSLTLTDNLAETGSPESRSSIGLYFRSPNVEPLPSSDIQSLHTPFPRTSGVRFSPRGHLVAFGLPTPFISTCTASKDSHRKSCNLWWTPRTFFDYWSLRQQRKCSNSAAHPEDFQATNLPELATYNESESAVDTSFDVERSIVQGHIHNEQTSLVAFEAASVEITKTGVPNELWGEHPYSECGPYPDASVVQIYDFTPLMLDEDLVVNYSLNNRDVGEMCAHNYLTSLRSKRNDLSRFWQYAVVFCASLAPRSSLPGALPPWAAQPVGRALFKDWLDHFLRLHDAQNLALAVLVLRGLDRMYGLQIPHQSSILNDSNADFFRTDSIVDSSLDCVPISTPRSPFGDQLVDPLCSNISRHQYEMSTPSFTLDEEYESTVDLDLLGSTTATDLPGQTGIHKRVRTMYSGNIVAATYAGHTRFILEEDTAILAHYVSVYSSMLYSMGCFVRHAHLISSWSPDSYIPDRSTPYYLPMGSWPNVHRQALLLPSCPICESATQPNLSSEQDMIGGVEQLIYCTTCQIFFGFTRNREFADSPYLHPKVPTIRCSVCRAKTGGLIFVCPRCHHGGHIEHLSQWFVTGPNGKATRRCPTLNCHCYCTEVKI